MEKHKQGWVRVNTPRSVSDSLMKWRTDGLINERVELPRVALATMNKNQHRVKQIS